MNRVENAPLSELLGGLVADVTSLLRKEIDLAKAEASEKLSQALGGIEYLIVGLVLAIGAVGVLLSALVTGLAAFLVAHGVAPSNASAYAALIVGIAIAAVAWVLVSKGLNSLRGTNLALNRSAASLRRDVDAVKEKI